MFVMNQRELRDLRANGVDRATVRSEWQAKGLKCFREF